MTSPAPQPAACVLCGRPLRTAASRSRGIGPHCLRKLTRTPPASTSDDQLTLDDL
ncbi:DUF6011 domain-containing protein [Streptomyces aureocirculatus]|uniref:DUF6011 domain-containing protein n=1 Tax=Streptomyces aureocirculatus TaxID=67275 RepID=UPI000B035AED|nr:DUF6011 domain-containing protein [Streptomyces aureocirculatus]